MSKSSVLEGRSESSIVPPSHVKQRRPTTEQPLREERAVVQHRDALRREGRRDSFRNEM